MISFLTSALGGSLVGGLLNMLNGWSETFRKGQEAKIQIKLMEAQTASQEKIEAWKSFNTSQGQDCDFAVPAGVWPWVASVVTLLLGLVETLRRGTRPALTWLLCYIMARSYNALPADQRTFYFNEIVFATFTALFWWFGERYSARRTPTKA